MASLDQAQGTPFFDENGTLTEESFFSHGDDASRESSFQTRGLRRNVAAAFGAVIVVGCLVAVAVNSALQANGSSAPTNARQLFQSKALIEAATDSVMSVGKNAGRYSDGDRTRVRAEMARHFKNYGDHMAALSPVVERRLQDWEISAEQHQQIENHMRTAGDKRVQDIGDDVAVALRESKVANEDEEHTRQRVHERMAPRQEEMRQLQDEILPTELRSSELQEGSSWSSVLPALDAKVHHGERRLENGEATAAAAQAAATLAAAGGTTESPVAPATLPATTESAVVVPTLPATTLAPVYAATVAPLAPSLVTIAPSTFLEPGTTQNVRVQAEALLESASVLLSSSLMMVQMSGNAFKLPEIAMDFLNSGEYMIEFAECVLDHAPLPPKPTMSTTSHPYDPYEEHLPGANTGGAMGPMMMMMCPMQLGILGQTAIGKVLSEFGIDAKPFFPFTKNISIMENDNALKPATSAPSAFQR